MQSRTMKVCIAATRYILYADLAHLVERHLAKVEVAGSSPVIRSSSERSLKRERFLSGDIAKW